MIHSWSWEEHGFTGAEKLGDSYQVIALAMTLVV
jgi:hypothetical protein